MKEEEGEDRFKYSIRVSGVFGRNRTVKFKCETFHETTPDKALSDEDAIAYGMTALENLRLKKGRWSITRQAVKVEKRDGFVITKFMLAEYDTLASGSR